MILLSITRAVGTAFIMFDGLSHVRESSSNECEDSVNGLTKTFAPLYCRLLAMYNVRTLLWRCMCS